MLRTEENELLCRVGKGTPMGDLMRRYWLPAMLSSELPKPDCPPVRVLLLGERLIAFRDTQGQVGLLANHCPHRGASLFFGRNEGGGLRCVYHGWKFDAQGACVDMPSEPPDSNFKTKVRATAYPCHERNGVVWAYLGPRENPPPLPDIEANQLPKGEWQVAAIQRECNWVQGLEGDIDTSHFGFLHFGSTDAEETEPDTFQYFTLKDRAPRYSVLDTEYGSTYGAYRPARPGTLYWRIAHFLFPFYAMIPTGVLGHQIVARAWVPMDDEHTMWFGFSRQAPPPPQTQPDGKRRQPVLTPLLPNTSDWYGRFRLQADERNDYNIDREWQREGDYTGIEGIHTQDQAITESMGPIYDRTQEHLASSDAMVIRVRRRLLGAARALAEQGVVPPGAEDPTVYRQRSGGIILDEGEDWIEATKELRKAYVPHPELDPAVAGRP
ncbi:MAG: Rieske 2Fe-2S domain-containing protein [Candidatus Dormibacteraeota bacterium]|nr:Rieske 2Fe-2S domain-containing protein [Candidatus Dormibacteraeota bacterium]MBO0704143.1 Rieske 2Fe-2S domain-containing protein [Candidatus Dormibacteraeota bacterium]MBO0761349.1 Rieske 2Fe-2S domain-containing protein [Candidatus Dormibacteraeota bacterium]